MGSWVKCQRRWCKNKYNYIVFEDLKENLKSILLLIKQTDWLLKFLKVKDPCQQSFASFPNGQIYTQWLERFNPVLQNVSMFSFRKQKLSGAWKYKRYIWSQKGNGVDLNWASYISNWSGLPWTYQNIFQHLSYH